VANIFSRFVDILKVGFSTPDAEPFLPEHIAEGAFIMGAANGRLYQKTVRFNPGTIYFSFVVHNSLITLISGSPGFNPCSA
jgi:hypothetical protein